MERADDGFVAVDFVDENRGWVLGTKTILHTEDGGKTWTQQFYAKDSPNTFFLAFDFTSASDGWIVGGRYSAVVIHTRDGGRTWDTVPAAIQAVSGANDKTVYLASVKFMDSAHGWIGCTNG
jgi:photosystem II stability/assembly factor-like uncharacterized protein